MDYKEKIARELMRQDGMNDDWFFDNRELTGIGEMCREYEVKADQILHNIRQDCEKCEGTGGIGGVGINDLCEDCQGTGGRTLGDILDLLKAGKLVEKENK